MNTGKNFRHCAIPVLVCLSLLCASTRALDGQLAASQAATFEQVEKLELLKHGYLNDLAKDSLKDKVATAKPEAVAPAARINCAQLVKDIERQAGTIQTIAAELSVTLINRAGKTLDLDGVYNGDADGNFHLQLSGMFNTRALDVVRDGDRTICLLPTRKLAIVGNSSDAMQQGDSDLAMLLTIAGAKDLFFPLPWAPGAQQRRASIHQGQVIVSVSGEADAQHANMLRRFQIGPAQSAVRLQEIFTPGGQMMGRVSYLGHLRVGAWPAEKGSFKGQIEENMSFPQTVQVADGEGNLKLQLKIEKLVLNAGLPAGTFTLTVPADHKRRDLSEMIKAGESLFPR